MLCVGLHQQSCANNIGKGHMSKGSMEHDGGWGLGPSPIFCRSIQQCNLNLSFFPWFNKRLQGQASSSTLPKH
jgi:hypothetical protein